MSMQNYIKTINIISTILLIAIVTTTIIGCSSTRVGNSLSGNKVSKAQLEKKAQALALKAESTENQQEKNNLYIESAYLYSQAELIKQAEGMLEKAPPSTITFGENKAKIQLTKAKIASLRGKYADSIFVLNSISEEGLPSYLLRDIYITKSKTYSKQGNTILAAEEVINLNKVINSSSEIDANNKYIFNSLQQLTPSQLADIQSAQNTSHEMQGWISFVYLSKKYDSDQAQVIRDLKLWQQKYRNHPANEFMPSLNAAYENNSHQIALLLPLTNSPYSQHAKSIRDGFLAATYTNNKTSKVKVYNTGEQGVVDAYRAAVNDGATFIVGPLTKENVNTLRNSQSSFSVPVLALNNTNSNYSKRNFFEFGLSPENEAAIVAQKAIRDGYRRVLIIVPKNDWGLRVANTFNYNWKNYNGTIIANVIYSSNDNLDLELQKALGIANSIARAKELKKKGLKVDFTPRRRQDIDMIFIATTPGVARQIKPLLNFYYAGDIPVYSTSSVYTGLPSPMLDQDLNGIKFCDMPWVLDNAIKSKSIYQTITSKWPQQKQNPRLFALGIDAYKISQQLDQLKNQSNFGLSGMTGVLRIDSSNVINRQLMWARFRNGEASTF